MSVKSCLELMPTICSYGMDPEWEFLKNIINEINCTYLIMLFIHL